jgi:predicted transcriptional regulator
LLGIYNGEYEMSEDIKNQVLNALESTKYKWRTIDGVAKEANIPKGAVLDAIKELSTRGLIVRSTVPSVSGDSLFTTRKHYTKTASISDRFLAALRNRST